MWDIKEQPTHYSKRGGHEVAGVVAVLCVVRQVHAHFRSLRHVKMHVTSIKYDDANLNFTFGN